MGNMPLFFFGGLFIGIVLFFVCERTGLLHKWSGLKPPASKPANQKTDQEAS